MAANVNPIFTRVGDFAGSQILTTAANDYVGQAAGNTVIYAADATNGSFVQRLRFKALGTNIATVARVYLNNGRSWKAPVISAVSGTPTGTPSASGGTLQTGNFFAKIYALDQYGAITTVSTETASVSVTGPTGSITWNWTAVTGAASYYIIVGLATGQQQVFFTSTTNSFVQTVPGTIASFGFATNNNFYGEISLPATTANAAAGTTDVDYPMNFAMPPGTNLICGLGTAVAAGWIVNVVAGKY